MRPQPIQNNPKENRLRLFWFALVPAAITFLFYLPVLRNGFVWDDEDAILKNLQIRFINWNSLHWMFTSFLLGNWTPLTWFSFALDYQAGHLQAWVYHLDNLLWHSLNTALVFFLALKIFKIVRKNQNPLEPTIKTTWELPGALLAAILFGLHPVHVEAVAWALERNDLLCGFFLLVSLLIYLDYATGPTRGMGKYLFCVFLFGLALLGKPMGITFPLTLFLIDACPLGRFSKERSRVLLEKIPFLTLSLLAGFMALMARAAVHNIPVFAEESFPIRLVNAFHSLVFYLWKLVWPVNLAVLYPLTPRTGVLSLENLISIFLVLCLFTVLFIYRRKFPYLWVSWVYYCVTLLPVLGLLQSGNQAAADRYTYLPTLGFFFLLAAWIARFLSERKLPAALAILFLPIILGPAAVRQIGVWRDPVTLWENAARVSRGGSETVLNYLADAYRSEGRLEEALRIYDQAIVLGPNDVYSHNGKAIDLFLLDRPQDSIREFKTAISINPSFDLVYFNFWIVCQRLKMYPDSLEAARELVRINPNSAKSFDLLGISCGDMGRFNQSLASFEKALELEPGNPEILRHLAVTRHRAQNPKEPMDLYQKELEGQVNL